MTKNEYRRLHYWVEHKLDTPKTCENCGTTEAQRYEWANLSGEYLQDTSDWARLCVRCHHLVDGIDDNLRLAHTPAVISLRATHRRENNKANPKFCKVENCARAYNTRGYCHKHYMRIWKNGTLVPKYQLKEQLA